MYVPSSFDVPDGRILESFISRYGFATLITSSSAGLIASHIPITLRKRGDASCLIGHVARANHQWRAFDGKAEALAIFRRAARLCLTDLVRHVTRGANVELRCCTRLR